MPTFAIINGSETDGFVSQIIVADSLEDANIIAINQNLGKFCIEYNPYDSNAPHLGDKWNGVEFISPSQISDSDTTNNE